MKEKLSDGRMKWTRRKLNEGKKGYYIGKKKNGKEANNKKILHRHKRMAFIKKKETTKTEMTVTR